MKGLYGVKLVTGGTGYEEIYQPNADNRGMQHWYNRFRGRTVTFGCWVYPDSAASNGCRLYLRDQDGYTYSSEATAGSLQWLEVTSTVSSTAWTSTAMFLQVGISYSTGIASKVLYASQPMLVFGNSIGSGNYTRPQGEIVWFDASFTSAKLNGSALSDVSETTLNIEADSLGKIPKGAKAVMTELKARDSGSAGTDCWVALGVGEKTMLRLTGLANDSIHHESGMTPCDSNGDFTYRTDASGSSTLDAWALYHGVQLR